MSDDKLMAIENEKLMEGRFGVIGIIIVISLMSWNVYTTNQLQVKLAVTNEKIENLNQAFSVRTLDRYTGADAVRDKEILTYRINGLNTRLKHIEDIIGNGHKNK